MERVQAVSNEGNELNLIRSEYLHKINDITGLDSSEYVEKSGKYYLIEPIEWRILSIDEDNEDAKQGKGAIYAKCDLKFTSSGNLTINANYNNGIHSSDDIKFKNTSAITVKSLNHAVKGNDSVEIESGKIKLISENGSGIKTENTSISSKGKQKGNIVISGGELEVYSYEDGIEAAHDVEITNDPKISIFTYSFSEYSNLNIDDVSTEKMYLRTGTDSYNYSVYFVDKNNNKTWVDATYSTSSKNSRGQTFYYYELKKPANSVSIQIFSYSTSTKTRTENNAIASSKSITLNIFSTSS